MSYPDSVRYLYSLGNELKPGAKFGLDRMKTLLAALGNPEHGQRMIHVAGTNGKGSTCAIIASCLRSAGRTTGLYTSPHLVDPTERIRIDGRPVSLELFAKAFETVHTAAEDLIQNHALDDHPSYFETVTAMAFLLFRDFCEISVVEVGLGGRLDATNVIAPKVCILTPISFDHESYLGNTLEAIAREKAGILKPGVPVIVAQQAPESDRIITGRALELGSVITPTSSFPITGLRATFSGSTFYMGGTYYQCSLPGRYQVENARTAILACLQLGISTESIQEGLRNVTWPGRLELIATNPDLVLDGAHNPAGAAVLAAYIREFCSQRPVWIVYGAMRDKAIDEVTSVLFPLAEHLILTAPGIPRALRPEAIDELAGHPNTSIAQTVPEALAIARAAPDAAVVFFAGSLFLVGEIKALLQAEGQPILNT